MNELLLAGKRKAPQTSYDDFVAWLTSKSYPAAASQNTSATSLPVDQRFQLSLAAPIFAGSGFGSSWGQLFGGAIIGAHMHACPDATTANENVTSQRIVVMKQSLVVTSFSMASRTRNGYNTSAGTANAYLMNEFIYWDAVLQTMRVCDPSVSGASANFVLD